MDKNKLSDLYMEAHSILEEMRDFHHGDLIEDDAKIAATVAALIINNMKEDK